MKIRNTKLTDLIEVMKIYSYAREQMKLNNNPNQWKNTNPTEEMIINDIKKNNSYVIEKDNKIVGVFSFIIGKDKTYQYIEGKWLNDLEYGTIHRIASNNLEKNIFDICINFCKTKINNIRIDTHQDNIIMRHILKKNNFIECGIIYVEDGSKRIAFQKIFDDKVNKIKK